MKRPPESASSVMAVIAVFAGERPGSCMMPVPSRIFVVWAAIQARGLTASEPHASAVQTESKPSDSASLIMLMSIATCAPE